MAYFISFKIKGCYEINSRHHIILNISNTYSKPDYEYIFFKIYTHIQYYPTWKLMILLYVKYLVGIQISLILFFFLNNLFESGSK